ncbi:MAG: flagellar hook-basal body complex protein [Planctomycetota bacterium]
MASTTALFTGLSGLNANSRNIDVIGNNIANVNTFGFKSSRMVFSSMFSRTLSQGTPPGDVSGGTNPSQVGLGVQIAGTQRNFSTGSFSTTGDQRDMAIEGNGFFVVKRGEQTYYTRQGTFRPNANNDLVTISGERVQGWGVDANFNFVRGTLAPVNIPLGSMTIAQATSKVNFTGNLDSSGPLPTVGTTLALMGTPTAGLTAIVGAVPAPTPPNIIEATTRLVDVESPAAPGSNTPAFAIGQTIRLKDVIKGGTILPTADLTITAATTVQDVMDFMRDAMGINTTVVNPGAITPGVTLDPLTGAISVIGNTGTASDLTVTNSNIQIIDAAGVPVGAAFDVAKTATADGESVKTRFIAYDSLGTALGIDITLVKDSTSNAGTVWRYYTDSPDDAGAGIALGTGTISFDTSGKLVTGPAVFVNIDRTGTGAATPVSFEIAFESSQDTVTSLDGDRSRIAATRWDGAPLGTLDAFGVGNDGTIIGSFSNGLTRPLGQIVLATFSSQEGLIDAGGGLYTPGANSGGAVVSEPLALSAGSIVGGALELSNVDMSLEFIGLIQAQTGYSAASRVITTTNELFQQLLALGR